MLKNGYTPFIIRDKKVTISKNIITKWVLTSLLKSEKGTTEEKITQEEAEGCAG